MAWRTLLESIFAASLKRMRECLSEKNSEVCSKLLVSIADALYSPLRPIDAGLGEVKRLASRLASIIASTFLQLAREDEEFIRQVHKRIQEYTSRLKEPAEYTSKLLEEAKAPIDPSWSLEPREAILEVIREYIEPRTPSMPRRRRMPRRPDPLRDIRFGLRELGRLDPILARSLHKLLRSMGLSI